MTMMSNALYRWGSLVLACLLLADRGAANGLTTIPVDELLRKVIDRANTSRKAPPQYEFTRIKTTTHYDSDNEVETEEQRVYRVALKDGRLRSQLIKKNGEPPAPRPAKPDGAEPRPKPRSGAADRRNPNDSLLSQINDDMVKRFTFTIVDRETIQGRPTLVIDVKPRKDLKARTTEEEVMARMGGKVWIDEAEHEVVQAHVNLQETLKIGWAGMLGALREFRFSVQRSRMDNGGWVNSKTDLWLNFRQLFSTKRIALSEVVTDVTPLPASVRP